MIRLLALLLLATSCVPVYLPNARNVPMFSKGGQFQGTAQMGNNGLDLQGAYSISNHVGIMTNYSYIRRRTIDDAAGMHSFHSIFEGGLGYFKQNDRITLEIFGGYGRGQGRSSEAYWLFNPSQPIGRGKYERYFLQPAIGVQLDEFHFAFASRISYVNFTEFINGSTIYTDNEPGVYFIEPALIGSVDIKAPLYATWQIGYSVSSNRGYYDFNRIQVSVGFGIRLPEVASNEVK